MRMRGNEAERVRLTAHEADMADPLDEGHQHDHHDQDQAGEQKEPPELGVRQRLESQDADDRINEGGDEARQNEPRLGVFDGKPGRARCGAGGDGVGRGHDGGDGEGGHREHAGGENPEQAGKGILVHVDRKVPVKLAAQKKRKDGRGRRAHGGQRRHEPHFVRSAKEKLSAGAPNVAPAPAARRRSGMR